MNSNQPFVRRYGKGPLLAGLIFLGACASSPPPPSQPPTPAPVVETPPNPPPAASDAPAQAAATEAPPPAPEPECQAAEDCKKVREPAAGLQWACENARCLEQPIAEAPKADQPSESVQAEQPPRKAKGKAKKK